jgi:indole-3-glycerol phosphate synthase
MKILRNLLTCKRTRLKKAQKDLPLAQLRALLPRRLPEPRFGRALRRSGIGLIAEIKKASPSAGLIRKDFDPVAIARAYAAGGARAISVLTEEDFFKGSLAVFDRVRKAVSLPLLRKDFIFDEYQLVESKVHGADAVLLIVALLTREQLRALLRAADALKLDVITEVHSRAELKRALACGAKIIGINNRDLRDFSVDLGLLSRLSPLVPKARLVVCESGVRTLGDLLFAARHRVHAVLIGEALMRSRSLEAATAAFADFLKKR